jgi:hypothetical protein
VRATALALALGAAAALSSGGCSLDGLAAPLDTSGGGGAPASGRVDAGAGGAGGATPDASAPLPDGGPKKREVYQRNPFGDVAVHENLLWDGDFEWQSAFSDEYGWIDVPVTTFTFTGVRVGPECRSGLKCAAVPKGGGLFGIAVTTRGAGLEARFWAKPSAPKGKPPSCKGITGMLTSNGGADTDAPIPPVADAPDASGWCEYHVVAPERHDKTYLYIDNGSGAEALVDDAVLVRAAAMKARSAELGPPTAEALAKHEAIAAELRKLPRGPHDAPPNAARRALEQWRKP